jgi:hypothetical protein
MIAKEVPLKTIATFEFWEISPPLRAIPAGLTIDTLPSELTLMTDGPVFVLLGRKTTVIPMR